MLGLAVQARSDTAAVLGADGGVPLVTLVATPDAAAPAPRAAGLFHLAILLPSRLDLGRWTQSMAASRRTVQGAADHLVSEAIYLADPEGNGIEIYRDRPRNEWPRRDGRIEMDNAPLDFDGLLALARADGTPWTGAPSRTRMGHIHLNVNDLGPTEGFYVGRLGFDAMATMRGALFVSAGGYHHHLGLNTWAARNGAPRDPAALGLRHAVIELPDAASLAAYVGELESAGLAVERPTSDIALLRDPSGNRLLLAAGARSAADHLGLADL
ncbi:Catechol-2,3-dioxygenase [Methylobrevis pamukkalensis]|uniref:Catechol-2,3-dioxygenase n=1 Tax=Methylobrevis pamukkalensis TaxID=1439726 RepID=A0A1E3H6P1_9HYPH|nr:Catechol-2,3-dioxygenase [Methylobrevis pamukkalensis]